MPWGGDHGPSVVIPGADLALQRHPQLEVILFGDAAQIQPLLDKHPRVKAASRLVHTSVRSYRQWELGERGMHASAWDCLRLKLGVRI